jgi:hypothetical protein
MKRFLLYNEKKYSSSAQKQATHTGKISGCYNFYERYNYKYSRHQVELRSHMYVHVSEEPANSMPRRLQDVTRKEGNRTKY